MSPVRDLTAAYRQLLRAPAYAATAVGVLALAIGAATVMASAVRAVLLRPLAMTSPEALVVAWGRNPAVTSGVIELSYLDVMDLARASRTVSRAAAVGSSAWPTVLDGVGDPAKLAASGVSGAFFATVGATAALGRTLDDDDDQPGARPVVVISHDMFVGRFGSDPGVVGRRLSLDGQPTEVVGVMPEGFDFPRGTDLWVPAVPVLASAAEGWKADTLRSVGVFYLVARMRPGTSAAMAGTDLTSAAAQLPRDATAVTLDIVATTFADYFYGATRPALWAAAAAVALLLIIACANVSGLMLTRAALASRDAAVRAALGASRAAVAAPWAWEAVLVTVAGGALGWLVSLWGLSAVVALAPDGVPGLRSAHIDPWLAAGSAVLTGMVALVCALAPARLSGRISAAEALADGGRSVTSHHSMRSRATLQVVQIALAVLLLVSAGLILRSATALAAVDLGFDPGGTLTLTVEPRTNAQPPNAWMADLVQRLEEVPGVEAAGAVYLRPLALGPIGQGTLVTLEGQPETPEAARTNPLLNYQVATPGYFAAMRIPVVRGRAFTDADTADAPRVTVVSEGTARRLWPGRDPIGQRLRTSTFERGTGRMAWRVVVGVVRDVRYRGLMNAQLDMYDPAAQTPMVASDVVVRTSGSPIALRPAIEREARALDPTVIVSRVATLDAIVTQAQAPWRLAAWGLSLFATLAIVLAMVGLIGLVALDVANRRREMAIRMALGAGARALVAGVMEVAMRRVVLGVGIGVALALAATRTLTALFVEVTAADWATYVLVALAVTGVALLASILPAARAITLDPLTLLRRD